MWLLFQCGCYFSVVVMLLHLIFAFQCGCYVTSSHICLSVWLLCYFISYLPFSVVVMLLHLIFAFQCGCYVTSSHICLSVWLLCYFISYLPFSVVVMLLHLIHIPLNASNSTSKHHEPRIIVVPFNTTLSKNLTVHIGHENTQKHTR